MNIQMILSTLTPLASGKQEPGTSPGQFALALNQAGQQLQGSHTQALAGGQPGAGLPAAMAAQQALLQAFSAHGLQTDPPLEGTTPSAGDTALAEIMTRLALIDATHGQQPEPASPEVAFERPTLELPQNPHATVSENIAKASDSVATAGESMAAEMPRQDAFSWDRALAVGVQATELEASQQVEPGSSDALTTAAASYAASTLLGDNSSRPASAAANALGNPATTGGALPGSFNAGSDAYPAAAAAERGLATAAEPVRSRDGTAALANPALATTSPPTGPVEPRAVAAEAIRGGLAAEAAGQVQHTNAVAGPASATLLSAPTQSALASPVQSQAWPGQLGQQLVQFARLGGEQQIEMRLNPVELGPLSVTLKMTEQGAQAQFLAAHAQVRQVLEQAIPQLREALAEQGITLGETSVGEQRRQDAQAFAGHHGEKGQSGAAQGEGDDALAAAEESGSITADMNDLSLDGRVNLYA